MKKVISISLAMVFLLGSIGIAHGTHFCGGHAVVSELMIGKKHLDCGMGMMDMPEHKGDGSHLASPGCCENQYVSIGTEDLFQKQQVQVSAPVLVAVTVVRIAYSFEYGPALKQPVLIIDPSPPLPSGDLNILYQTFLI